MQRFGSSRWAKRCILSFVAVWALFLGGCGSSDSNTPVWNITSAWNMFYATTGTPGERGPDLFTLTSTTSSGNNLAGVTSQGKPITGKITGLDISFSFVDSDGATNTSTGTVAAADGSTMSGTWTKTNGQSGKWHSVIAQTPRVSVAGTWSISQTTSGVTGEQGLGLFTFAQSGYGISGTTSDGMAITGAIGLSDISFFWVGSDNVTHTLTGIIAVNASGAATGMSGTWYDTSGKTGTWRATKG